jgi:hypothetical protein
MWCPMAYEPFSKSYKQSLIEILSFPTKKSMTRCLKQLHIECNHRILFQILCENGCNHILMVHLTNRWWYGNRKDNVVFSLQIFIHMESMIDDKVTWMSNISFENVIMIKSLQIWLKTDYANDVSFHTKQCNHKIILQWFKNDYL